MDSSRYIRSITERIYLLSANQTSQEEWEFKVRGQSLNVYIQRLKPDLFYCSCPDHKTRGSFCKHLLFLLLRVARCQEIGSEIQRDKSKWDKIKFNLISKKLVERLKDRLQIIKEKNKEQCVEGDCPICFEEMNKDTETIKCVITCKNWFHKECMNIWLNNHDNCPLCRSPWVTGDTCEFNEDLDVKMLSETVSNIVVSEPVIQNQRFEEFFVTEDIGLKDFCMQNRLDYRHRKIYCELIKPEYIEKRENVIFWRISDNQYLDGADAQLILGLNLVEDKLRIKPQDFITGKIFVEIYSLKRKLISGQKILLEN